MWLTFFSRLHATICLRDGPNIGVCYCWNELSSYQTLGNILYIQMVKADPQSFLGKIWQFDIEFIEV